MADKSAAPQASRSAAPSVPISIEQELIALQAQAENNMAGALQLLRHQACTPSAIQKALARSVRAATALRRMSAAVNKASGVSS